MSRRIWDFPGGIHPPQNKHQSNSTAIEKAPIPVEIIIPLVQHIGAPAKPIVNVGESVLKGQIIANAAGYVSVPKHAPTSGVISAIELRPVQHPSQIDGLCIIIKPDGKDQWIAHSGIADYQQLEPSELIELIRNSGVAGMGGAGFPTSVKLNPSSDKPIEHLIINAVECEPYITSDDRIMRERAVQIILGIEVLAHILKPKTILIGIEDNKPEAIMVMTAAAQSSRERIQVITVPTKYPSGGEKQIIQVLTGKEVPSGKLPVDVGVVCHNTGTTYAVYDAVINGRPLISRVTTTTGDAFGKKGNLEVLIGTPVKDLLREGACDESKLHRLVMGGPMMGFTMHDTNIPVVKTTNCIIAASEKELPDPPPEQACIRCTTCAQACPMSLLPQQLYWFSKAGEFEKAQQYNLADCIECGACAYVCPSNIPLVNYYRFAKGSIRELAAEAEKSDHARVRFEARQERLEQEAAEKEAKRKARAEKAAAAQKAKTQKATNSELTPNSQVQNLGDNSADTLTLLKTTLAKATKNWKDADSALSVALGNESADPAVQEKMRAKVSRLKLKAEAAKTALDTAQAVDADTAKLAATPAQAALADDPLAQLKQVSQDTFNAYRAKKAEVEAAGQNATPEMQAQLADLKAISDQTKVEVKKTREKQREEKRAKNLAGGEKDLKQLKLDVAVTAAKVKKAQKALATAEADTNKDAVDPTKLAELNTAIERALSSAEAAEQAFKQRETSEETQ